MSRGRFNGVVKFSEKDLLAPLSWKKPRRVFVNSMSDLFHENVLDEWIDKIFAVMALTPQHTYQILTKRPERMHKWLTRRGTWPLVSMIEKIQEIPDRDGYIKPPSLGHIKWPLPNVWLGVSVEDQKTADERIPLLLKCPAAVRWISAEPLLGPIDLTWNYRSTVSPIGAHPSIHHRYVDKLGWVVVGGESGPNARPCDIANIRSIVQQCKAAGVPVFVKQLGADPRTVERRIGYQLNLKNRKGGDMNEWPEDLRVREFPEVPTAA
jgi:protein gp37